MEKSSTCMLMIIIMMARRCNMREICMSLGDLFPRLGWTTSQKGSLTPASETQKALTPPTTLERRAAQDSVAS